MHKQPAVYILASDRNGTIYIGVTSDLMARVHQHRAKALPGFTARYDVTRLVWFEMHETMNAAISREKQLKAWRREWMLAVIETDNPYWRDLAEDFGFHPSRHPDERQDSGPRTGSPAALDAESSSA